MISFELTEEQKQMQETAHKFSETEMRPNENYRKCEESQSVPAEMAKGYGENAFGLISLPEDVGGLGQDLVTRAIVEEELCWGDAGISLALDRAGVGGPAICALASADQRKKLLGDFGSSNKTIAWCLSEDDIASDTHASLSTKASGGKITGKKRWVLNAPDASLFVVAARVSDEAGWAGVKLFAVEKGAAGLKISDPDKRLGVLTAKSATVEFDNTPATELAGAEKPAEALQKVLNTARVLTAARLVGIARASAEYATSYAMQRPAFGKMIGQFQSIAFMIADAHTEVNSARWMAWRAARAVDANGKDATKDSCLALVHAADVAVRICTDGVQVLGGAGFIQDYPVEKWLRDARQLSLYCGAEALHTALAADQTLGVAA
ncbi:MAG: acyl-CoA dehydrogenase family protein [Bdellovibrionota bacterium]